MIYNVSWAIAKTIKLNANGIRPSHCGVAEEEEGGGAGQMMIVVGCTNI